LVLFAKLYKDARSAKHKNLDVVCADTEEVADMKRNVVITPEHSQVLTLKSPN